MGVVGPSVVRVGVEDDEPAHEGDRLVQPAGLEGGKVIALVLGRVEEVDEKPLEQKKRHAPPRTPCVVHCRGVESDCTPMAGEVQECRSIAPLRELDQTLLRNDPFGPDKVLHATVPLPMRRDKRNTRAAALSTSPLSRTSTRHLPKKQPRGLRRSTTLRASTSLSRLTPVACPIAPVSQECGLRKSRGASPPRFYSGSPPETDRTHPVRTAFANWGD